MTADAKSNGSSPAAAMPAWIEAKLFEKIVKENVKDYQKIESFSVKPGSAAGENYATLMLKIEMVIALKDGSVKPLSFMMKTSHDNDVMREMMKSHDMFDVEKSMYDDIVPTFEKLFADVGIDVTFGPKSYEIDSKQEYILLENLTPKGFKNADRLKGLDREHAEHVLTKLAMWHAASVVHAKNIGGYHDKYLYGFFRPETKEMMKVMQAKFRPTFQKCLRKLSNYDEYGATMEASHETMIEAMYVAAVHDPEEFNVLNHGDCWANNIMFQYDDMGNIKETYLIDYQLPKYGTPAQDLYYFLLSSTQLDIKLSKFDYFIRFYHENLCKNLKLLKYTKTIPTLIDIHKMLFKYGVLAVTTATGVMAVVLLDPTETASMENFISESEDGDAFRMLMYSNSRYRKHLEAILPWLHNRGALHYS